MRNDLRNITTKRLFSLKPERFEQYHNTLKHLKAKPVLKGKQATPIESLSFGEVITIKQILNNPNIEGLLQVFKLAFNLNKSEVLSVAVVDFYHAFNWLESELKNIEEKESEQLVSKLAIDPKLKEAGIDELKEIGIGNTLIDLGEMFGKDPDEIESWKYAKVFLILKKIRITNDINKRHTKILNRK